MKKITELLILSLFVMSSLNTKAAIHSNVQDTTYAIFLQHKKGSQNVSFSKGDKVTFKMNDGRQKSGIIGRIDRNGMVSLVTDEGIVLHRENIQDVGILQKGLRKYNLRKKYKVRILEKVALGSKEDNGLGSVLLSIILIPLGVFGGLWLFANWVFGGF